MTGLLQLTRFLTGLAHPSGATWARPDSEWVDGRQGTRVVKALAALTAWLILPSFPRLSLCLAMAAAAKPSGGGESAGGGGLEAMVMGSRRWTTGSEAVACRRSGLLHRSDPLRPPRHRSGTLSAVRRRP